MKRVKRVFMKVKGAKMVFMGGNKQKITYQKAYVNGLEICLKTYQKKPLMKPHKTYKKTYKNKTTKTYQNKDQKKTYLRTFMNTHMRRMLTRRGITRIFMRRKKHEKSEKPTNQSLQCPSININYYNSGSKTYN